MIAVAEENPVDLLFAIGETRPANGAVALMLVDGERYLLQRRSLKAGIYFPGYWGLFGGAAEPGEDLETTLRREIAEELGYTVREVRYFTETSFDFSYLGCGTVIRRFYEVALTSAELARCRLTEGDAFRAFDAAELFREARIVPYDAFAIWMHVTRPT